MEMARRPANPKGGEPAFFVVSCHAPRKRARFEDDRCDGFVGRFPGPMKVLRLIGHSDEARSSSYVASCKSCGQLHELAVVKR